VSPAKPAEPIEMPFGVTRVDPYNHALDEGEGTILSCLTDQLKSVVKHMILWV